MPSGSLQSDIFNFNQTYSITSTGDISTDSLTSINVGGGIAATAGLDATFEDTSQKYFDNTSQLFLLNDYGNANSYLNSLLTSESGRMTSLQQKTFNQVQKTRVSYLMKKYRIAYDYFVGNIFQFTSIIVIILAILFGFVKEGKLSFMIAGLVGVSIVLIYLIILLIIVRNYQYSRAYLKRAQVCLCQMQSLHSPNDLNKSRYG